MTWVRIAALVLIWWCVLACVVGMVIAQIIKVGSRDERDRLEQETDL